MKCNGITSTGQNCIKLAKDNTEYCTPHEYQSAFTADEIEQIRNKTGTFKVCTRCSRWKASFEGKKCASCKEDEKKSNAKASALKKLVPKCKGIDRDENQCRNNCLNETNYCTLHQYLINYTQEMLDNLHICGCCNKAVYKNAPCHICQENRRKKIKEPLDESEMCKVEKCDFKANKKEQYVNYCGKHQTNGFIDEMASKGLPTCSDAIRSCRNIPENGFKKCFECRAKECKIAPKEAKSGVQIKKMNEFVESKKNQADEIKYTQCHGYDRHRHRCKTTNDLAGKYCLVHQYFKNFTEDEINDIINSTRYTDVKLCEVKCFHWHNGSKNGCIKCLEIQKIKSRLPHTIERKNEWKESNPEKCIEYSLNSRAKKISNEDVDYWEVSATGAKTWRDNNPDKVQASYKKQKNDPSRRLSSLKKEAFKKGIEWLLSDEEAIEMISSLCHYCNEKNKESCNSIDRKNSKEDYSVENCVPCCTMCNFMKNTLEYNHFLVIIEHICAFNELHPDAQLNYNIIPNIISGTYLQFRNKAILRNKDFFLLEDEFNKIINNCCYICGKKNIIANKLIHRNGIDRFDNNIGYIMGNCRSCCGTCNIIKNDFMYELLFDKILKIYLNSSYDVNKMEQSTIFQKLQNKKTREELQEISENNKLESKRNMINKYNDKNWIKDKISEIMNNKK